MSWPVIKIIATNHHQLIENKTVSCWYRPEILVFLTPKWSDLFVTWDIFLNSVTTLWLVIYWSCLRRMTSIARLFQYLSRILYRTSRVSDYTSLLTSNSNRRYRFQQENERGTKRFPYISIYSATVRWMYSSSIITQVPEVRADLLDSYCKDVSLTYGSYNSDFLTCSADTPCYTPQ